MEETKDLDTIDEIDNNDDMIANEKDIDKSVSFKVSESSVPERGWTKKQMRSVWIIGIIVTILVVICSFFLKDMNIFGIFA